MKIEYTQNPLFTKITLDDHEKEIFKLKIRIEELEQIISEGHFTLTHHEWWNKTIKDKPPRTLQDTINKAIEDLDPEYWMRGEKSKLDARVDELFNYFIADLQDRHAGDCCCIPCSCTKCHAENMLGIDTIKGLGRHEAYKINATFADNTKTIDEVLEILKENKDSVFIDTGNPHWTKEHHDYHLPRWRAEGKRAYDWLLNYKDTVLNSI